MWYMFRCYVNYTYLCILININIESMDYCDTTILVIGNIVFLTLVLRTISKIYNLDYTIVSIKKIKKR